MAALSGEPWYASIPLFSQLITEQNLWWKSDVTGPNAIRVTQRSC